jgi:hypothetical protein
MSDTLFIEKAIEELQDKRFGTTAQFLNIHEVVYADGKPQVLRVDREKADGTVVVYFPIKAEKFYLAVYLGTSPEVSVTYVGTENYNAVYFRATSGELTLDQLSALTKLKATKGWSKGDPRKWGNSVYDFSAIHFEPDPGPDEFEDKLNHLLDFLEQDRPGVSKLVDNAYGYIQVATVFHNGNTMLGGHHLDKNTIKRLGALDLEIDLDLYAEGNSYQD